MFAGGNGFPPEDTGGVQSSTIDLALRLAAQGDHPSALVPLYGDGIFGVRARMNLRLSHQPFVRDRFAGFPTYRAWAPEDAVEDFVRTVRPDVAVVQCHNTVPIARAFQNAGVPTILYFRNVEMDELGGDPTDVGAAGYIANSSFTASVYKDMFCLDAVVIPPTVDAARVATKSDRSSVVFINPVAEKGLDLAIKIAADCPEIPFLFIESWLLSTEALASLKTRIAPYPNITFERRKTDVRDVYRRARVLLAPSVWREAWGRVASEAQCSGIPVIGSDRGGLPEAIGPGGIILPVDAPVSDWSTAIRRLWTDDAQYRGLVKAAAQHAARPEMDPDHQFQKFAGLVSHVAGDLQVIA